LKCVANVADGFFEGRGGMTSSDVVLDAARRPWVGRIPRDLVLGIGFGIASILGLLYPVTVSLLSGMDGSFWSRVVVILEFWAQVPIFLACAAFLGPALARRRLLAVAAFVFVLGTWALVAMFAVILPSLEMGQPVSLVAYLGFVGNSIFALAGLLAAIGFMRSGSRGYSLFALGGACLALSYLMELPEWIQGGIGSWLGVADILALVGLVLGGLQVAGIYFLLWRRANEMNRLWFARRELALSIVAGAYLAHKLIDLGLQYWTSFNFDLGLSMRLLQLSSLAPPVIGLFALVAFVLSYRSAVHPASWSSSKGRAAR
jgi:hypothetical protein